VYVGVCIYIYIYIYICVCVCVCVCVSISEVNGDGRNTALNLLKIKLMRINDQRSHLAVQAFKILST